METNQISILFSNVLSIGLYPLWRVVVGFNVDSVVMVVRGVLRVKTITKEQLKAPIEKWTLEVEVVHIFGNFFSKIYFCDLVHFSFVPFNYKQQKQLLTTKQVD